MAAILCQMSRDPVRGWRKDSAHRVASIHGDHLPAAVSTSGKFIRNTVGYRLGNYYKMVTKTELTNLPCRAGIWIKLQTDFITFSSYKSRGLTFSH